MRPPEVSPSYTETISPSSCCTFDPKQKSKAMKVEELAMYGKALEMPKEGVRKQMQLRHLPHPLQKNQQRLSRGHGESKQH